MTKNREKIQIFFNSRNQSNYYQNITSYPSNTNTKHTDKSTDKNYEQISKGESFGNGNQCVINKFGFISSYERSKRKPINMNKIINSNKTNHYNAIIKTNNYSNFNKHINMSVPKNEHKIKKIKEKVKLQNIKSKSHSFCDKNRNQKNTATPNNIKFKKINLISQNYKVDLNIKKNRLKTATINKSNFLINKIRSHIHKINSTNSEINIQHKNISSNSIKSNINTNIKTTKNKSIISKKNYYNKRYFNTSIIKKKQVPKITIDHKNSNETSNNKISDISNTLLKDEDTERKTFKILSIKHINSLKSYKNLSPITNKNPVVNLKINLNIFKNNSFQIHEINCKSQETQKIQKIEFIKNEIKRRYNEINDNEQESSYDNSNENFKGVPNKNNYINKNYNFNKLYFKNNLFTECKKFFIEYDNNEQIKTINKLINKSISWDLSPRNGTNEPQKIKNIPYKKEFKFITDIENEINKITLLKISNILKLKNSSLFHLLSFIYEYYSILIKINNNLTKKIISSLKSIFSPIVQEFKEKYSTFLEIKDFYFQQNDLIINKKKCHTFNLVIVSKITTHEINKSFEISCDFKNLNKKCDYFWKFDILNRKNIKVWYNTEIFYVNRIFKRFTFSSQVSSFSFCDEIKLIFNIFNEENIIIPKSVKWMEPKIINIQEKNFKKIKYNTRINDPLRICEIEKQILTWREYLNGNPIIIREFINIFQKYFKITGVFYDKDKIDFYKIEMVAFKKGKFSKNKFLSFDINIISYDDNLENELQCIYLMNSNSYFNKTDIRIGTQVTFYITDYK